MIIVFFFPITNDDDNNLFGNSIGGVMIAYYNISLSLWFYFYYFLHDNTTIRSISTKYLQTKKHTYKKN